MERYSNFTAEEFLNDPFFREWLVVSDEETDQFWKEFLLLFPEKQKTVLDARILFKALARSQTSASTEQGDRMWENIRIHTEIKSPVPANVRPVYNLTRIGRLMAAASIVLLIGVGWFLIRDNAKNTQETYAEQTARSDSPLVEKINQEKVPMEVLLPDGSQVLLYPLARISYETRWAGSQRTVYLAGKAHFRVVKDDTKPFLVYANKLVTQVVGTSFTVDSPSAIALATVTVETGKVKVYTLESFGNKAQGNESKMIATLTPNQKIIYDPAKALLTRGFVEVPTLLDVPETYPDFYFENTAVASVFKTLEESYGVTIRYEASTIQDCSVTAPLGNEPLFRKLDIICQTIGATYEVWGTEIVVEGPGCGQ